ncbi:MAG: secretin and TonB N-terminal domain-containing protein [Armatimonadota bacterium]|nr:secretin and TonB N-terminal domain-containing protein [Armatimonadota bacterium]
MRRLNSARSRFILLIMAIWLLVAASFSFGAVEKRITLDFKSAPIDSVIAKLFEGTGLNYALAPGATGTVTVTLRDVPFEQALQTALRSANLTYRLDDGVYVVGPQNAPVTKPSPTYISPSLTPTVEVPSAEMRIEKIPLNFSDAFDIAEMLGSELAISRGGAMTMSGSGSVYDSQRFPGFYGYGYSSGLNNGSGNSTTRPYGVQPSTGYGYGNYGGYYGGYSGNSGT